MSMRVMEPRIMIVGIMKGNRMMICNNFVMFFFSSIFS